MAKETLPIFCILLVFFVSVQAALPGPTTITFASVQSRQVTLFVQFSDASASGKRLCVTFTSPGRHTVTGDATISGTFATLSLSGLLPGTNYTVRAFVVDGSNQGQAKVSSVTTAVDVPSGPVRELNTSSISSRSVTLTWNPPEANDINSPNGLTGYYVELRRFERNRCEGRLRSTTTKARRRRVTFNNLQPVTAYCVVVFPENEGGRARELHVTSGRHTFTTSGEAPSDSPTLTIVQPQFTQLTLAWDEPSQPNGALTQYIIQYRINGGNWNEVRTTALSRYKVLSSVFASGRRYQLRMAAVNAHGRGPFCPAVEFTMQPPVSNIKFCRLNTSSAKLIWKLRSQPSLGAQLVQLRFAFSGSGQPIERYSVDKSASGHVVPGLTNKAFQLSVGLVWSERERLYFQSDDKDLGPLQTDPNCFPSQPINLEAESVNPKGFTLTWSEPSTPNGQISKYIITVKSRDSRLPYEETFVRVSNRTTVDGLEEAVQYRVRVRAVNEFEEEGPTVALSVTTTDSVPTGPALNIEVERISTTAVSVTWEAPDYEDINAVGGITGYRIVIGNRKCNQISKSSETTNLRVVFDNLEPGSSYCVRVIPFNNVGDTPNDIVRNSAVRVDLPDVLPPPVPVGQTVVSSHAIVIWKEVESNDEENPLTNYIVDITNSNKTVPLPPGSVYYNMTGLSPGSTYTVKVAAKNGLGVGRNATFTVVTKPAGAKCVNVSTTIVESTKESSDVFTSSEVVTSTQEPSSSKLVSTSSPTTASTPTSIPTSTPTSIPTSTPTSIPTSTPTSIPTSTPTSTQSATPTPTPTPPSTCPEYFIFPRTTVGEAATIPCPAGADGRGMYGDITSKCGKGGVWGSVNMSQCAFRRDVTGHRVLWLVELDGMSLQQLINRVRNLNLRQAQDAVNITEVTRPSHTGRHVYSIQISNNTTFGKVQMVISPHVLRGTILWRGNGCNCCSNSEIDVFSSNSTSAQICDGEELAHVPCLCENGENKCGERYSSRGSNSNCYLDTDGDENPDVEDPCVGCCLEEFNIFRWPQTNYGETVEANCSGIHPSFGGSKISRTCRRNDTWDPLDIGSCTFKNTAGNTSIILFNTTVNVRNVDKARDNLMKQARNLVPSNFTHFNVTVTEVAKINTAAPKRRLVIFAVVFPKNTPLVRNFTTSINDGGKTTFNYIQGVVPSDDCSCSDSGQSGLRRLCIGTTAAPCDCNERGDCMCVDPYIGEGGTCALDTDGDGMADYQDPCPYQFGEDCTTVTPPPPSRPQCTRVTDTTWELSWRDAALGVTLYTRCPGGVDVSAGLANRKCRLDGTWGEVNATQCISRAFMSIQHKNTNVKQVLTETIALSRSLSDSEREVVAELTQELRNSLNVSKSNRSILPKDLTTATDFIEDLAGLSVNNGLFAGRDSTKQKMDVVGVISGVLDSRNDPAFRATSTAEKKPAVSLLRSTEELARTGFVRQDNSVNETNEHVADTNIVVQYNRLNPLSSTLPSLQVRFPNYNMEFSEFARAKLIPRIVIPGDFLKALVTGTRGRPDTTSTTTPTTDAKTEQTIDVVSFTLDNIQEHLPLQLAAQEDQPDDRRRVKPGSLIVSSQVVGVENTAVDSGETVNISFNLLDDAENITVGPREQKLIRCAFWNFTAGRDGSGAWSFDGIRTVSRNGTHVQCTSNHLTSFIVLVSIAPVEPPLSVFPWITYIGCGISLLCLLISMVFFLSLRKELITRTHNFIRLNLCVALSCGLVLFLGGMEHAGKYEIVCQIVSALQHYFFLAVFCWMLCEAIMIYSLLVRLSRANDKKWILLYLALGWGLPVPAVAISAGVRHYNYFIRNTDNEIFACWLPVTDGLIAAFIGPVLAISFVSVVMLAVSVVLLAKSSCGRSNDLKQGQEETVRTAWRLTKGTLVLLPLLALTWIIGLLAVGPREDVMVVVFVVLNSLTGVVILLIYVVGHEKVWSRIKGIVPTCKSDKHTLMTDQSAEGKSTHTDSLKQTATSKSLSETGDQKVGLFSSEAKDGQEDLGSIKDGEGLELEVKQEDRTNQTSAEMTTTTFGNIEPSKVEEKTNGSTRPKEGGDDPAEQSNLQQPQITASSFGFSPTIEKVDPTSKVESS